MHESDALWICSGLLHRPGATSLGGGFVATRPQPKLLAQGKPRMLGGATRGWRVRLYAPGSGTNKYQVYFRAPAGEGEPWKRVLRRASSEEDARKIFAQAEAALDTESETPAGADIRASRTIRMLGEEYLADSIERGKQPRTMEGRESRLTAHSLPTIGEIPVTKWRVVHSRKVMEKGSKTLFSQRGREDLRGQVEVVPRGLEDPRGDLERGRLQTTLVRRHRRLRRTESGGELGLRQAAGSSCDFDQVRPDPSLDHIRSNVFGSLRDTAFTPTCRPRTSRANA